MNIGESSVSIKLEDEASAMIDNACERMEKAANRSLLAAVICSGSLLGHAVLLYLLG